jgi:hypothetical protein
MCFPAVLYVETGHSQIYADANQSKVLITDFLGEFSLMMECDAANHVAETVNICNG